LEDGDDDGADAKQEFQPWIFQTCWLCLRQ
jgi:hypothetical protein